jgi:tetratricopeptide (TPR) repeat protein
VGALARFYATTNQPDKAEEFLDIALTIGSEDMYMWYDRSLTYVALDRIDEAIAAAEQLVAKGYSTDILATDLMFSEIADDPRFRKILKDGGN